VTTADEQSHGREAKERACPQCGEPAPDAGTPICMICGGQLPPPGPEGRKAAVCPRCGEPAVETKGDLCMVCGMNLMPPDEPAGAGRSKRRNLSGLRRGAFAVLFLLIATVAAVALVPSFGAFAGIGTATVEGGGNLILQASSAPGSVDVIYQGTRDGSQPKVLEIGVVCPGTDTALNLTRYLSPEPGTVFGPFPTAGKGGSVVIVVARPEYADGTVVTETIAIA